MIGAHWQELQHINRHADVIGVSYYPLGDDEVDEPTVLPMDLARLFRVYPEKQVDFYQFGYPSSTRINGSLEKQRQFVQLSFDEWDRYKDKIRLITFTWLYDVQQSHVDTMAEDTLGGMTPSEAFNEFLGSLGLLGRRVGEEKPAFVELKKQASVRGWRPK